MYDRRVATAEAAIPNLQMVNSALLGMMRAWKGEMEGRLRPELTASTIRDAHNTIAKLSEDGFRAVCLLRFHFGTEVGDLVSESDHDSVLVQELLSEFMTANDTFREFLRTIEAASTTDPEKLPPLEDELRDIADTNEHQQIQRLARIIDILERRRVMLSSIAERVRSGLAAVH